jgi:hypothetical protein
LCMCRWTYTCFHMVEYITKVPFRLRSALCDILDGGSIIFQPLKTLSWRIFASNRFKCYNFESAVPKWRLSLDRYSLVCPTDDYLRARECVNMGLANQLALVSCYV